MGQVMSLFDGASSIRPVGYPARKRPHAQFNGNRKPNPVGVLLGTPGDTWTFINISHNRIIATRPPFGEIEYLPSRPQGICLTVSPT